ncbi:MAG: hypothetical protein ACREH8_10550 [Opitutaceae bacterium]
MLFSPKNKGFFIELNDYSILVARTSGPVAPFTIEEMRECPVNDPAALEGVLAQLQPKKSAGRYVYATVGIHPASRLVRRHTLELKRVREPAYFPEICSQQFRIEPDKYSFLLLNANDGTELDAARLGQKEVVFCGLPKDEANAVQAMLLDNRIYPERIELGTVSTLGAVVSCLGFKKSKAPALLLEIGADTTHSFIVTANGVEASRPIQQGLDAMVPIVQKELGLKDEESARKLFYSNTFDFTGMGPLLIKKLLKELQSSIGFYEVQTGQSVAQVLTTQLSPKLQWLEGTIAGALGITSLKLDPVPWLQASQITVTDALVKTAQDIRWLGVLALMPQQTPVHAVAAEEKK